MASLSALRRALAYRNTRIFFAGSLVSWTGLWVQRVAVDWLAWQLTHSPLWTGILAFCNLAPSVLISPLAGAAADRMDRVHLTMLTQALIALHAGTLAILTFTGVIRIEMIAALEVFVGTCQAFAQPARQSMVPGMVARTELPGAVALNSLCFNLARSVGPGIGGIIIATGGVVPAMLVNCAGYIFASVSMSRLHMAPEHRRGHAPGGSVLREALDGLLYVLRHPGMGPLFIFAAVIGVLVRPVQEMLPPFVANLFQQDAQGLAILSSTIGMAALVAGICIALRGRLTGLSSYAVLAALSMTIGTAAFVATHSFPFALGCAAIMGASNTLHGIAAQTLLQTATAGPMLGRVLSLWGMIIRAAPALGALTYGAAAERFGLQAPVLIGCILAVGACVWILLRLPQIARTLERVD